jgi:ABC-type nitrate/sulfonate/bicarbonate transport system substrate-binding protein
VKRFVAACIAVLLTAPAFAQTKMTIATGVDPAFSQFYVATEAGIFAKNGLDVSINTGPSGSAMVPFLINDQVDAGVRQRPRGRDQPQHRSENRRCRGRHCSDQVGIGDQP